LFQTGLISADDYKQLIPFLKNSYTQEYIGRDMYYIRNDKL